MINSQSKIRMVKITETVRLWQSYNWLCLMESDKKSLKCLRIFVIKSSTGNFEKIDKFLQVTIKLTLIY